MPLIDGRFCNPEMPSEKHRQVIFSPGRILRDGSIKPWRERWLYGGRNGYKDWSFAAAAIEIGVRIPKRLLFTREVQLTIKDSAHQLLCDTVKRLGYDRYYKITDQYIETSAEYRKQTGIETKIIFRGLNDLVSDDVKSMEGIDICVICEAQNLEEKSWNDLNPTIRKPGSEIWGMFNVQYEDDFVYQHVVEHPHDGLIAAKVNYTDTDAPKKMISQVILDQAELMKRQDPDGYEHIWLGDVKKAGGRFYPGFTKEVHCTPHECNEQLFSFKFLARHAQLFMAMDPHTVYYPFCLWIARIKLGEEFFYVVYNEFPTLSFFNSEHYYKVRKTTQCTLTMNDLATMFRILDCTVGDEQYNVSVVERYVDTRFAKASGAKSWSTNTEGLITEFAKPENGGINLKQPEECIIDVQKDIMREAIKINDVIPVCSINQSRLLVMPHCHNFIDSAINHRFDRDNTTEDEKRKDPSDAARICFAGMSKYPWRDPVEKEEEKPFLLERQKIDLNYSLA